MLRHYLAYLFSLRHATLTLILILIYCQPIRCWWYFFGYHHYDYATIYHIDTLLVNIHTHTHNNTVFRLSLLALHNNNSRSGYQFSHFRLLIFTHDILISVGYFLHQCFNNFHHTHTHTHTHMHRIHTLRRERDISHTLILAVPLRHFFIINRQHIDPHRKLGLRVASQFS